MIRRHGHEWVRAAEAADLLGEDITEQRVRDWGRRGLCARISMRGVTLYRWEQVRLAERQTRLSGSGRKRGATDSGAPIGG